MKTYKLQLIVASQVDQLWRHVVTNSNPVCPHEQTTVAKYPFHGRRGGRRTISRFMSDKDRVFMVASPKTKTETETRGFQDQRPKRPRLWGSKTKTETETRGFQNQDPDQDSEVPRPRPRPRLEGSKTKTQTQTKTLRFQDQDRDQDL